MKLHKRRLKRWYKKKISDIRVKILLKRHESLHTQTVRNEFRLNQFITLRLIEYGKSYTNVFICISDEMFPLYKISFKDIFEILNGKINYSCMDDACLHSLGMYNKKDFLEDPDTMFLIYCYYIAAWVEYDYDWRLLRVDDAFPILKALYHAGDPKAREVFKIEIIKAFLSGYLPAIYFLTSTPYYFTFLDYFEFEEMIYLFEKCLKIVSIHKQNDLKAHFFYFLKEKSLYYYYRDNFEKAIQYLNEALKIFPFDIETLKDLGVLYLRNGDYQLAKALLIYVIDLSSSETSSSDYIYDKEYYNKPYIIEAWSSLGKVNNQLLLFSEAIIACRMAMYLDKEHVNTWNQIVIAYEGMGDFQSAKAAKKSFKKQAKVVIKNEREVQY